MAHRAVGVPAFVGVAGPVLPGAASRKVSRQVNEMRSVEEAGNYKDAEAYHRPETKDTPGRWRHKLGL